MVVGKLGDDSAAKFINALIKSVQTLCHGYLDFNEGIQIIGHINLSVDEGTQLDYILKEKVCKGAENSTLFVSNSFHAEAKSDDDPSGKRPQNLSSKNPKTSDTEESGKLGSAISSISSALSNSTHKESTRQTDSSSHSDKSALKRKATNDDETRPAKISSNASLNLNNSTSQSPYHSASSPVDSKEGILDSIQKSKFIPEDNLPQTSKDSSDDGLNLAGSVLEQVADPTNNEEDRGESENELEVTFIKEEYVEGEDSCEYGGQPQFPGGPSQKGMLKWCNTNRFNIHTNTA